MVMLIVPWVNVEFTTWISLDDALSGYMRFIVSQRSTRSPNQYAP